MTERAGGAPEACQCRCGYSCGRRCGLEIMDCIEQHYRRDCGHLFDGPDVDYETGRVYVSSVTCSRCGLAASEHDLAVGP